MTAFTMPMEARRAIQETRRFHALVRELAQTAIGGDLDILDGISARLHGRVAEFGYGIRQGAASGGWSGEAWDRRPPASMTGGSGEIGYVMVALADESLIRLIDWPGRDRWPDRLLEERIYGTRVAGDRVFALAESLEHRRDPDRIGLAAAIYLALLMGFRGRYVDDEPPGLIDSLLDRMHTIAFGHRSHIADALAGLDACSVGEALPPMPVRRLPALRPWLMAVTCVLAFYLGAGHWLWSEGVDEILGKAASIQERLR